MFAGRGGEATQPSARQTQVGFSNLGITIFRHQHLTEHCLNIFWGSFYYGFIVGRPGITQAYAYALWS